MKFLEKIRTFYGVSWHGTRLNFFKPMIFEGLYPQHCYDTDNKIDNFWKITVSNIILKYPKKLNLQEIKSTDWSLHFLSPLYMPTLSQMFMQNSTKLINKSFEKIIHIENIYFNFVKIFAFQFALIALNIRKK